MNTPSAAWTCGGGGGGGVSYKYQHSEYTSECVSTMSFGTLCVCVCHIIINTVNIQMNVYPLQCDLTMHNQRSRTDHPGV